MSSLKNMQRACAGIEIWLSNQGLETSTRGVSIITAKFLKSKGLPYTKFNKRYEGLYTADIKNAISVQKHFKEFKEFFKENYLK